MFSTLKARAEAAVRWLLWTPKGRPPGRAAAGGSAIAAVLAKPLCAIEGCGRPRHARGLCGRHYAAARRKRAA
jgi:hypothetical protein